MGTTRPISFCVENNINVKVQTIWKQSFIIKFTGGNFNSGNYEETVRFNNVGSFSLKIDWKTQNSDSMSAFLPYYIRPTFLGF